MTKTKQQQRNEQQQQQQQQSQQCGEDGQQSPALLRGIASRRPDFQLQHFHDSLNFSHDITKLDGGKFSRWCSHKKDADNRTKDVEITTFVEAIIHFV